MVRHPITLVTKYHPPREKGLIRLSFTIHHVFCDRDGNVSEDLINHNTIPLACHFLPFALIPHGYIQVLPVFHFYHNLGRNYIHNHPSAHKIESPYIF